MRTSGVWYESELKRRVSVIVSAFAQEGDTGFRRTRYQAEVRPALWRLGLKLLRERDGWALGFE